MSLNLLEESLKQFTFDDKSDGKKLLLKYLKDLNIKEAIVFHVGQSKGEEFLEEYISLQKFWNLLQDDLKNNSQHTKGRDCPQCNYVLCGRGLDMNYISNVRWSLEDLKICFEFYAEDKGFPRFFAKQLKELKEYFGDRMEVYSKMVDKVCFMGTNTKINEEELIENTSKIQISSQGRSNYTFTDPSGNYTDIGEVTIRIPSGKCIKIISEIIPSRGEFNRKTWYLPDEEHLLEFMRKFRMYV